jgi:hypothetical protein
MKTTWLIVGIIIYIISLAMTIFAGYEKYSRKSTSTTYTAMFWSGIVVDVLSLILIIVAFMMKPKMAASY